MVLQVNSLRILSVSAVALVVGVWLLLSGPSESLVEGVAADETSVVDSGARTPTDDVTALAAGRIVPPFRDDRTVSEPPSPSAVDNLRRASDNFEPAITTGPVSDLFPSTPTNPFTVRRTNVSSQRFSSAVEALDATPASTIANPFVRRTAPSAPTGFFDSFTQSPFVPAYNPTDDVVVFDFTEPQYNDALVIGETVTSELGFEIAVPAGVPSDQANTPEVFHLIEHERPTTASVTVTQFPSVPATPNNPFASRFTPPVPGFAAPVNAPVRATQVTATPSTVNSVIAAASPGTQVTLSAGAYDPIRVTNKTGISIVVPVADSATVDVNSFTSGAGVTVTDSEDIVVSGIHVTETLWGVVVRSSTNVIVANNHVHHIGQEAIHIGDNSSHVLVANNHIHHTGQRPGVQAEQNLLHRTFGEGVYLGTGLGGPDTTNNVVVSGNHIHNTSSEAIDVKHGVHTVAIYNNVIHDVATQTSAAVVTHLGTGSVSGPPVEIVGNIIWNTSHTSRYTDGNAFKLSSPANMRGNIIWDSLHRGVLIEDADGQINLNRNVIFGSGIADVVLNGHRQVDTSSNLGDEITRWPVFASGLTSNNQPTPALIRLVEGLTDPNVPLSSLEQYVTAG